MLSKLKELFTGPEPESIEYRCNSCDEVFSLIEGDEIQCPHCDATSARTTDPKRV